MADFLLWVGGAMTVTEYWYVNVFRPGFLSNMLSLGQIGQCIPTNMQRQGDVSVSPDPLLYIWWTCNMGSISRCLTWTPLGRLLTCNTGSLSEHLVSPLLDVCGHAIQVQCLNLWLGTFLDVDWCAKQVQYVNVWLGPLLDVCGYAIEVHYLNDWS